MPVQQLGRRRRRNAAPPVGDLDEPVPRRHRRGDDAVDAQQVPADGRADDIGDRIDRADLVKMDLLDRRAVDFGLGLGRAGERSAWPVPSAGRLSRLPSIISVMWCRCRWACSGWMLDRDLAAPESPFASPRSATSRQPGSPSESMPAWIAARSTPASTSAPSVMSPLMPLRQSRYAIFMRDSICRAARIAVWRFAAASIAGSRLRIRIREGVRLR